jgi:hypothetical protein
VLERPLRGRHCFADVRAVRQSDIIRATRIIPDWSFRALCANHKRSLTNEAVAKIG